MASIDGGHYYLTVLAPIRRRWVEGLHKQTTAPMILLRERLATLPTAQQTPGTTASGFISNFSKSSMTHFARFAVIDRLGFNGYVAPDPVFSTLGLQKSFEHREELKRPYLLFGAEFDAPSGSRNADLAVYLRELWEVMGEDLRSIFGHCVDFDPDKVTTAADFIAYIKKCEIETTMPFNAYWTEDPKLPTLTARGLLGGAAAGALSVGGLVWWLLHGAMPRFAIFSGLLAGLLVGITFIGLRIKSAGDKRFPRPPYGDLPTVLKAIHLQTAFGSFVSEQQCSNDEDLHAAFGKFVADNRPASAEPAHPAGKVYR